ncbi:hypothetical protein H8K33_13100 [Undibacterium amnicola]|uniref:Uncharacterized protein n=1 Tax=Undibacterium amnicola TaxID=1834038 RepID=A0ABR6XSJ2_9BURK|nr:hypothetical protein [Undibacterium amnicola]
MKLLAWLLKIDKPSSPDANIVNTITLEDMYENSSIFALKKFGHNVSNSLI